MDCVKCFEYTECSICKRKLCSCVKGIKVCEGHYRYGNEIICANCKQSGNFPWEYPYSQKKT